eukprot:1965346-Rhodomonas_salina.1
MENYEQLADVDMLEPSLTNHNEAMRNVRLSPFWIDFEKKEMDRLWKWGCFKKWKHGDLLKTNRVFGSCFHYDIKCHGASGQITNCKVQLVVMGNNIKEGEDYVDAFAP